jgi:hypothetical protein
MTTEQEQVLELYDVYNRLQASLAKALGISTDNQKRPIARNLRQALNYLNAGRIRLAEFHFLLLIGLVNDLRVLQKARPELFQHFSKKLGGCMKLDQYYGLRFELHAAANLVEKRIAFQKTDPPDFTLPLQGGMVYFECGSTHTGPVTTEKALHNRLERVVRRKAGKGYATPNAALFVDISSCVSEAARNHFSGFSLALPNTIRHALRTDAFGSILLFHHLILPPDGSPRYTYGENGIAMAYTRVDSESIGDTLQELLDAHFPRRDAPVEHAWWTVNEG